MGKVYSVNHPAGRLFTRSPQITAMPRSDSSTASIVTHEIEICLSHGLRVASRSLRPCL